MFVLLLIKHRGNIRVSTGKTVEEYTYDEVIWRGGRDLALILGLSLGLGIPLLLGAAETAAFFVVRVKFAKKAAWSEVLTDGGAAQ